MLASLGDVVAGMHPGLAIRMLDQATSAAKELVGSNRTAEMQDTRYTDETKNGQLLMSQPQI